jgi:acyl-CoA hydrolase
LLLGDIPFAKDESIYGKFLGNFLNVKNWIFADYIRPTCYFVSPGNRKAVNEGKADYITTFLNETGRLYDDKKLPVDVAFMNLSPPDQHGYCTLGVSVDSNFTCYILNSCLI